MNAIYQPSGRAREYSPFALNVYAGCTHGCKYCYVPRCMHMTESTYFTRPAPRFMIAKALAAQLHTKRFDQQVLLSFVGDCFCETQDESRAAIECLELLAATGTPTAILTKGGRRLFKAHDVIVNRFNRQSVAVGATLTCSDCDSSLEWERGAALPDERIEVLRDFHADGVKTFASFEPVVVPEQSLAMMRRCVDLGCVDVYKVGKLNNHPLASTINWAKYLREALSILRPSGCEIYVKDDLAAFAKSAGVELSPLERDADAHTVKRAE